MLQIGIITLLVLDNDAFIMQKEGREVLCTMRDNSFLYDCARFSQVLQASVTVVRENYWCAQESSHFSIMKKRLT